MKNETEKLAESSHSIKADVTGTFKISPAWDCIKSFDELVADARFIFSNDGHKGKRPRIVLREAINGIDCIEIDHDRYGLITNGETKFNEAWGEHITDSSQDYIGFIKSFLIGAGAGDILNCQ